MDVKETKKTDEDAVSVYELRFNAGYRDPDLWIEGSGGGRGSLRATKRLSIEYLPRRQFYRVEERPLSEKARPLVFFIPREWAMWIPLDGQALS